LYFAGFTFPNTALSFFESSAIFCPVMTPSPRSNDIHQLRLRLNICLNIPRNGRKARMSRKHLNVTQRPTHERRYSCGLRNKTTPAAVA